MKKIKLGLSIAILTLSLSSQASWTEMFSGRNLKSCAVSGGAVGGYDYMQNRDGATAIQNFAIGCVVGGTISHLVNSYIDSEADNRAEVKLAKYRQVIREYRLQDRTYLPDDLIGTGLFIKKKTLKTVVNPDGTVDKNGERYELKSAGSDLIFAD